MKKEATAKETEYEIGKYIFSLLEKNGILPMSSIAQEESRSISENITWGQRKSFSDGSLTNASSATKRARTDGLRLLKAKQGS